MDALDKLWRWRENFSVTLSRNVSQTWEEISVKGDEYSVVEDVFQDFLVKLHLVKICTFLNIFFLEKIYSQKEFFFKLYRFEYSFLFFYKLLHMLPFKSLVYPL